MGNEKRSVLILVLLLTMTCFTFNIQFCRPQYTGTIYIEGDGDITPSALATPIQRNGNVYTFKGNITDELYIQKNNTMIDGQGFAVQGTATIHLLDVSNVTIRNLTVTRTAKANYPTSAIRIDKAVNCTLINDRFLNIGTSSIEILQGAQNRILGNYIANCPTGITLESSNDTLIVGNYLMDTRVGIEFRENASRNVVVANQIENAYIGIFAGVSSTLPYPETWKMNSSVYLNNFLNASYRNVLNDFYDYDTNASHYTNSGYTGLLEGGLINFWNNATLGNYWSNYNGTDSNHDGIGDTPYIIDEWNRDNYPLMVPIDVSSLASQFTGLDLSIPEFPLWIILPIFMIATLIVAVVYFRKRKH